MLKGIRDKLKLDRRFEQRLQERKELLVQQFSPAELSVLAEEEKSALPPVQQEKFIEFAEKFLYEIADGEKHLYYTQGGGTYEPRLQIVSKGNQLSISYYESEFIVDTGDDESAGFGYYSKHIALSKKKMAQVFKKTMLHVFSIRHGDK